MERFSGGLKKGGAAAATFKSSIAPIKGKFKLRTSRDPLPMVTKKQPSRETKPKATFLTVAGAGASTEKQNNTKLNSITSNSFIQPLTKDGAPLRKSSGFSFMKFQSKSRDSGESTGKSVMKATPLALTGGKPFLGKFSAQPLSKKIMCTTSKADNATLFKPQEKKGVLFSFRADTKSSVAKKRKASELIAHNDGKTAFPCKNGRAKSIFLENPATNKDKEKQPGVPAEKAGRKDGIRSSAPFAIRMGERSNKVDDGAVLKKRGLLSASAIAGPALKKSKRVLPSAVHSLQNTGAIESGSSSVDICQSDRDQNVSLPRSCMLNTKELPLEFVDEPVNSVLSCAEAPLAPGKCGIEEELALKLVCTADDDKDDEFLARAAAIQEFTDRVGLEQKLICNRLLDAHADVSESLLDALTDLMAEEGGIGIDKLDFDLNIDVDVGDAFLQDDEIQVFQ